MVSLGTPAARRAYLFCDFQPDLLNALDDSVRKNLVARARELLLFARKQDDALVAFVTVSFRPGYPEVSPNNRPLSYVKQAGLVKQGTFGAEVILDMTPLSNEPVVNKTRFSAFENTDLAHILRANNVSSIVLAGYSTTGVILSSSRRALDLDFEVTYASDACADRNAAAHDALMKEVFPMTGTVKTVAELMAN